jgi:hypothetical protein
MKLTLTKHFLWNQSWNQRCWWIWSTRKCVNANAKCKHCKSYMSWTTGTTSKFVTYFKAGKVEETDALLIEKTSVLQTPDNDDWMSPYSLPTKKTHKKLSPHFLFTLINSKMENKCSWVCYRNRYILRKRRSSWIVFNYIHESNSLHLSKSM